MLDSESMQKILSGGYVVLPLEKYEELVAKSRPQTVDIPVVSLTALDPETEKRSFSKEFQKIAKTLNLKETPESAEEQRETPRDAERQQETPERHKYVDEDGKIKRPTVDHGKVNALYNAGWTAQQIADEMHISAPTVYKHIDNPRKRGPKSEQR